MLKLLKEVRLTLKSGGIKAVWKKYGWKIFAGFFTYYLVRDLTLYVFLPWYIASKLV